ncbi:hypothetical protein TDB9533_00854 [Thalassocella blandensis]|nr:hypothetical protein TDB9533_00854 [Thalassocella blandensis]
MNLKNQVLPLKNTEDSVNEQHVDKHVLSVKLGTIMFIEDGYPMVHWADGTSTKVIRALSQVRIGKEHINKTCTLAFVDGDLAQPIVMGILYTPNKTNDTQHHHEDTSQPLVLKSDDFISLEAGQSKIQLHANGLINIQGMSINSQAYGPNKLKGASVKIN